MGEGGTVTEVKAVDRRISFEDDVEETSRDGMFHRLST